MVTQDTKRRPLKLKPDEIEFWKDLAKGLSPNCLLLTERSPGCSHLAADHADDVIRELRKRVRK